MSAKLIVAIVTTLFSWLAAGCTVHFFWQFFCNTTNFSNITARGIGSRVISYGYFLFVWVGVGYCIFRGAEATLQWMPRSWVNVSDDGDAEWKGHTLAGTVGFFGSLWVVDMMQKLAGKLERAERGLQMNRNEHTLASLMPALQKLASNRSVENQMKGAKLAVWRCISREMNETDKASFLLALRFRALGEEANASIEDEKLFWRDVAQYATAPIKP